jgi:hypothetical protein
VKSRPRKLNAKGLIAGSLSLRIDPHQKVDSESMRVIADRDIPDDEDDRRTDGVTIVSSIHSIRKNVILLWDFVF